MTQKQQILISLLCKYCRQFFLYNDVPSKKGGRVRLRNNIHCIEQCPEWDRDVRIQRRMANMGHGMMVPNFRPYNPVHGWPILALDDLVLGTFHKNLDPKAWNLVKGHFERREVKRVGKQSTVDALKDQSDVHAFAAAGFDKIKQHLSETAARMHVTKCGSDYVDHYVRTYRERMKRQSKDDDGGPKIYRNTGDDVDVFAAKERVRRGELLFLVTLKELTDKLLLLRTRHLKSLTPISLDALGTDKDLREEKRHKFLPASHPSHRVSFREQILMQAPSWWAEQHSSRYSSIAARGTRPRQVSGSVTSPSSVGMSDGWRAKAVENEVSQKFRRRWPPLWQSLAAVEQGFNAGDPVANHAPKTETPLARLKRKKSFTDIKKARKDWAQCRQTIARNVDDELYRVDQEKVEFFYSSYGTLRNLPVSRFYDVHREIMENKMLKKRTERQKQVLYDCELPNWYRVLGDQVKELVGKRDLEINAQISDMKTYFRLSPVHPKFAKAKLALMVMSMPATVVCHVHVQRALHFLMHHVMGMPEDALTQWLSIRGLPFVVVEPSGSSRSSVARQ